MSVLRETADDTVAGDQLDPCDSPEQRGHDLRRRLEALLGIPASEGNALTVLKNGDEIFPAMLSAIREAQRTIDFLTFVYWKGDIAAEFAWALAERAQAGLDVRVLIDAVGGRLIDSDLIMEMGPGPSAGSCRTRVIERVCRAIPPKATKSRTRAIEVGTTMPRW